MNAAVKRPKRYWLFFTGDEKKSESVLNSKSRLMALATIRGRGQHAEDRHHQQQLHDHERRVAIDVAERAADLHGVRGHRAERQEKEDDEEDVEQRLPQVVLQLELQDFPAHRQAASACGCASRFE